MRPFLAILKKELRSVRKEKTIVIAIGIQLFIASFSSVILVGLLSFYDPASIALNTRARIRAGILGNLDSPLVHFLQENNVRPVFFTFPEDAEKAFAGGAVDAVLFIPDDDGQVANMQLFLPEAETRSTIIMMVLREPLKQFENHLRGRRGIHVNYLDLEGKAPTTYEFLYATIIPILMFMPGFVAGSMVVDSIASELEHNTLDTLWSAPITLNHIFGAKIAAALLLAVAQTFLWVILLSFNHIAIQNLSLVLLLAAMVAGLNGVGAAIIATVLKDRERAQFVYSLLIPLAVMGGFLAGFSPISLMTQLAAGDFYASFASVFVYILLLIGMALLYIVSVPRLVAIRI